jgi:hypothetical protein
MAGIQFPVGVTDFLFSTASKLAVGSTKPPMQWNALIPVVKWPGREADHTSSIAEVMKDGNIPPFVYTSSWHGA